MIQGDEGQQRPTHNGESGQPAGHARAMRPLDDAEQPQGQRHNGEFQDQQISPRRGHGDRKMSERQWCSAPALAVAPKTTDSLSGVMT